ncbi:MAG: hypothetical protein AAGI34_09210 [Pseudomonadota bacterium]
MAMTDEQRLAALREAYFSGTAEVQIDGRTIKYRSMSEIQRAIRLLEARRPIGGIRVSYLEHDRGT